MGSTPGKKSKTGRKVIERMKAEGKISDDGKRFKYNGNWYDISQADMIHIVDAVSWWNDVGRNFGPKSKNCSSIHDESK